jgi:hypothetical protein
MLEGAESEGCWRVQNPSSIKEKPKVGQCIMTYIMRYLFVYDILLQFLSSPYQSSPLKGPVSRALSLLVERSFLTLPDLMVEPFFLSLTI